MDKMIIRKFVRFVVTSFILFTVQIYIFNEYSNYYTQSVWEEESIGLGSKVLFFVVTDSITVQCLLSVPLNDGSFSRICNNN